MVCLKNTNKGIKGEEKSKKRYEVYININSRIIYDSQKMKTIQISINWLKD